jgi:hypothetical protein
MSALNAGHVTDAPITHTIRTFTDENTGREIRQLTDFEHGAHLGYFRFFRQLPGGRMLANAKHAAGNIILLDPQSGEVTRVPHKFSALKVRETDGHVWFMRTAADESHKKGDRRFARQLWSISLADAAATEPRLIASIPDDTPGEVEDITIDGRYVILRESHQDLTRYPIPTTKDVESINHYFSRPRRGAIWAYDVGAGRASKIFESEGHCPLHIDTSPADPVLIRFCRDMIETQGQRAWTVRVDGSELRKIRPQERGEMVTHEFWWADPNYIGYTYQDRRQDPTVLTHHWAEYALAPTRLGIADLQGREVYLSDPINCYHSHLYMSPDGRYVSGEGTHDHSFVYAAAFNWGSPKLDMVPLATIHTEYVPFRGQGVDCNFSADGKWLIYADKIGGAKVHQLYAVEVEL